MAENHFAAVRSAARLANRFAWYYFPVRFMKKSPRA
jgi:hypothetical protein